MNDSSSDTPRNITVSINKQTLLHAVLAINLGLLIVFAWQIVGIKNQLSDQPTTKVAKVDVKPSQPAANPPSAVAAATSVKAPGDEDHYKGSLSAKITLIEYSDFECPFCERFHPTAQQAVDEYNGQVNWVYRHFPLAFHPTAQKKAEGSECAAEQGGDKGFWAFADELFKQGTSVKLDQLASVATAAGLNADDFQTCLDSGKHAAKVAADFKEGQAAGVTGTPGTLVYNNETGESTLIPGALPFAQLKSAIDSLL